MNEALAMFTENGAIAAGLNDRGRIEVGRRGDITVLEKDLVCVPPEGVKDVKVVATISRGELVFAG